jgi:hypothetical protein
VGAKALVCALHVPDYDRDVLEPVIVAPSVGRMGTARRRHELDESEPFCSNRHRDDAHPGTEHAQ